jgi:hypothetical protein
MFCKDVYGSACGIATKITVGQLTGTHTGVLETRGRYARNYSNRAHKQLETGIMAEPLCEFRQFT